MIQRQHWIDHKFNLGLDVGWTQNVLSRVQDTAIRLEHHCKNLSDEQLSSKTDDGWTIKEHIGHLTDLEDLWSGRFQEFTNGHKELVMADMSNQKTKTSNHNEQKLTDLLIHFNTERKKMLDVYNALDEKAQNHQAMHPRIKMLMRPVDLLFFVAEHDDHHITSIKEIIKTL